MSEPPSLPVPRAVRVLSTSFLSPPSHVDVGTFLLSADSFPGIVLSEPVSILYSHSETHFSNGFHNGFP